MGSTYMGFCGEYKRIKDVNSYPQGQLTCNEFIFVSIRKKGSQNAQAFDLIIYFPGIYSKEENEMQISCKNILNGTLFIIKCDFCGH